MIKPMATLLMLTGFATAAVAQSTTVTLYGLVDLSVQHLRSGDRSPLSGQDDTRLTDGTVYGGPGSRWGLRVIEDLGGGLKTGVLIEAGFLADTGNLAQGGRAFGRQSYIFLGGRAGDLRLGRQYILHDETLAVASATRGTTMLHPGSIYTLTSGVINLMLSAPRIDNAVQYLSPTMNGFRAQAMIALSEETQDRYQGLKGSYSGGSFNAALTYEQSKANVVPPGGDSTVNKVFVVGANYDFGGFKLYGGYEQVKDFAIGAGTQIGTLTLPGLPGPATELKAYNVGASIVLGKTELMTNYTRSRFSSASGADVTIGRYGVGAAYSLSKLTTVYAVVAIAAADLKDDVNEKQFVQVGLRKAF